MPHLCEAAAPAGQSAGDYDRKLIQQITDVIYSLGPMIFNQIVNEMKNSGGRWLSIHARAYYDYSGKASSKAFTCAKKLLETGIIKKV